MLLSSERCKLSAMICPSWTPSCSPTPWTQATMPPPLCCRRRRAIDPPTSAVRPARFRNVIEPWRLTIVCEASRGYLLFRRHRKAALFQLPQQPFERALLAPDLETHLLRAVEKRDGEQQRRERFPLPALLLEETLDRLREVPEVPEAERPRQIR